tara:strand:- start:1029 stop:1268 length:240 start_codon:yes stop_codon:yes gene_type:complete
VGASRALSSLKLALGGESERCLPSAEATGAPLGTSSDRAPPLPSCWDARTLGPTIDLKLSVWLALRSVNGFAVAAAWRE